MYLWDEFTPMAGQQVLWVTESDDRPDSVPSATLFEASTEAEALEWIDSLEGDERLDAVVAAPGLPDGDGPSVLRSVRDRWPDAACILYGDLWEVPRGSSPPVCEFHPASQTPEAVGDAVDQAIRGRYHRSYPVYADEERRLGVVDSVDATAVRPDLEAVLSETRRETDASLAAVLIVDDYTVRFAAASGKTTGKDIPRGNSVSAYAIGNAEPTIVPDVRSDERLTHVDEYCETGHRSYAAVPVWVEEVPVGTLSVLKEEPGAFSPNHGGALSGYTERVETALASTL